MSILNQSRTRSWPFSGHILSSIHNILYRYAYYRYTYKSSCLHVRYNLLHIAELVIIYDRYQAIILFYQNYCDLFIVWLPSFNDLLWLQKTFSVKMWDAFPEASHTFFPNNVLLHLISITLLFYYLITLLLYYFITLHLIWNRLSAED